MDLLTDPSLINTLSKLVHLELTNVTGSVSFVQNLTQLTHLGLYGTQMNGSLSFIQSLTHGNFSLETLA